MDKLRKIALWLWYNKERMVLAIMFVALCYQVYKVWNPEPPEQPPVFRTPSNETEGRVDIPQPLPPMGPNARVETSSLERNPFTRVGGQAGNATRGEQDIKLLRIIRWSDGSLRAELQDARERGFFAEGVSFGTYEVLSIDEQAETVEVYSAEQNRRITLTKE